MCISHYIHKFQMDRELHGELINLKSRRESASQSCARNPTPTSQLTGYHAESSPICVNMPTKLPPIQQETIPTICEKPKKPFPITTGQLIGWKSTKKNWQLEKYGRYAPNARGRIGIIKIFDWPQQGV